MRRVFLALVFVLSLSPIACDSGDGGGGSAGSPEAAAVDSAESAADMGVLSSDPASEAGLGAALKAYGDLQTLVFLQQTSSMTAGLAADDDGYVRQSYPLSPDCVTSNGNVATYTDCQVETATLNGTVQTNGDDITVDFEIDVDTSSYMGSAGDYPSGTGISISVDSVTVTESGTLTITPTSLDGTLNVGIAATMTVSGVPGLGTQTLDQDTDIEAVFDNVVLEDGCAVAGTMSIDASGDLAGTGQGFTATYDGCGNATVE